jgi:hypothetical protein
VLEALAVYQNEDGGFGHALEPDIRAAASSVIATSTAFGFLRELGASARTPIVQRGVQYLLDSFDPEREMWPIVPPEVEDAPHAWWWSFEDSAATFGNFLVNPRAAIVGHLQHYSSLVAPDFLSKVKSDVLSLLKTLPDEMSLHDFECYRGLVAADNLPDGDRKQILKKLKQVLPKSLDLDREKGSAGEVFKPLVAVPSPDSALAGLVDEALIQENLDVEIAGQLPDGSWPLGWDWSPIDQEAWNAAEREWKGTIIVNKLRTFRAYGRLSLPGR